MLCAELENVWWELFNFYSSREAPGISFFRIPTKDDEYSINWRDNIAVVITRDSVIVKRHIKTEQFKLHYHQEKMICHLSKLFLLNCIFHYISNCSKESEFYLTSFFNMNGWRVKFRNFLGDFPVYYAALFINRTINNNYNLPIKRHPPSG